MSFQRGGCSQIPRQGRAESPEASPQIFETPTSRIDEALIRELRTGSTTGGVRGPAPPHPHRRPNRTRFSLSIVESDSQEGAMANSNRPDVTHPGAHAEEFEVHDPPQRPRQAPLCSGRVGSEGHSDYRPWVDEPSVGMPGHRSPAQSIEPTTAQTIDTAAAPDHAWRR
jgi:hypothetical protein